MRRCIVIGAAGLLLGAAGTASADLVPYSQDFEALNALSPTALGDDGWLVGANVFDPAGNYLYNYFAFPAPNGNTDGGGYRFSAIATGEGGVDQGAQQMSVFSDYNNGDQGVGNLIESVVFREYTIGPSNPGATWTFSFDAKRGDNIMPARAFIKTLDPNNGYALSNFLILDMTSTPTAWSSYSLSLPITGPLVGQIFQIGFDTTGSNYDPSTTFYDNINLSVPAPSGVALLGVGGLLATRRRR